MYDFIKNEITDINKYFIDNNNGNTDMSIYSSLSTGKYYLKVINNDSNGSMTSNIRLDFKYNSSNTKTINLDQQIDVMEHLHIGSNEYLFKTSNSGLYYINLEAITPLGATFPLGTIEVYYGDIIINKININNYVNDAKTF